MELQDNVGSLSQYYLHSRGFDRGLDSNCNLIEELRRRIRITESGLEDILATPVTVCQLTTASSSRQWTGNGDDSDDNDNDNDDRNNDQAPKCCPCAPAYGGGWWFYR